jgi:hypothetical protein
MKNHEHLEPLDANGDFCDPHEEMNRNFLVESSGDIA